LPSKSWWLGPACAEAGSLFDFHANVRLWLGPETVTPRRLTPLYRMAEFEVCVGCVL